MERLTDEEKLACSLISKYSFDEVKDVINETCEHQLEQDMKDLAIEKQQVAQEICNVYDKYVKALVEECDSLGSLAYVHGWRSGKVELGKQCRAEIKTIKEKYGI